MEETSSRPAGFFVLRAPALAFDVLERFSLGLAAPTAAGGPELARAVARDKELLRQRLDEWSQQPIVARALELAAPGLARAVATWRADPLTKRGRDAERTLVRYLTRMSSRPTPFGLFAGISLGLAGSTTRLVLGDFYSSALGAHLDAEVEDDLYAAAERATDPACVRLRTTDALAPFEDRVHFIRYSKADGAFELAAVQRTTAVDFVLERSREGIARDALARELASKHSTSIEEALDFVASAEVEGLLVADTAPRPTEPRPSKPLLAGPLATRARRVERALRAIQSAPLEDASAFARAGAEVQECTGTERGQPFQVDLLRRTDGLTLDQRVTDLCKRGADLLRALCPAKPDPALVRFAERFERRFGTRWVGLMEALDEERGVGFVDGGSQSDPSPLLADLPLSAEVKASTRELDLLHERLLQKILIARGEPAEEIALDDADLASLPRRQASAGAHQVLARLVGSRVFVLGVTGAPSTSLLARFAHLDPELERRLLELARAEEAREPEAIHAEIVHRPAGRAGNVVRRPPLRSYEIPCAGASSLSGERVVRLADLLVAVRDGRIVLWDRRRDQEVRAYLSSAHAFQNSGLGVYHFLCALQNQHGGPASWNWGPLETLEQLPRVVSGDVILARRRWRLQPGVTQAMAQSQGEALFVLVQKQRERLRLPRWVALCEGDKELVVGLDNVLALESFAARLHPGRTAHLVEVFAQHDVRGPDGWYQHELILPFLPSSDGPAPRKVAGPPREPACIARRQIPGDPWAYLKLYCSEADSDRVLLEVARELERANTPWFFLRYADPDPHLRVRLRGSPAVLMERIQAEVARGRVWRVVQDTYEREIERYGGDEGLALAEELFVADSAAATEVVRATLDCASQERWRLLCIGVLGVLEGLGLKAAERERLLDRGARALFEEHGGSSELVGGLQRRFKRERSWLAGVCGADPAASRDLPAAALSALDARKERMQAAAIHLADLDRRGALSVSRADFCASIVHMHVNRVVRSTPRAHEMAILWLLREHGVRETARLSAARRGRLNTALL